MVIWNQGRNGIVDSNQVTYILFLPNLMFKGAGEDEEEKITCVKI